MDFCRCRSTEDLSFLKIYQKKYSVILQNVTPKHSLIFLNITPGLEVLLLYNLN